MTPDQCKGRGTFTSRDIIFQEDTSGASEEGI